MSAYNTARAQFQRVADAIREGREVRHPERHEPDFETTVCGIPCGVVVLDYREGEPGYGLEPDEAPEIDWFLVDRRGYRAEWLEIKMTDGDRCRIESELQDQHQHDAAEARTERQIEQYRERHGL